MNRVLLVAAVLLLSACGANTTPSAASVSPPTVQPSSVAVTAAPSAPAIPADWLFGICAARTFLTAATATSSIDIANIEKARGYIANLSWRPGNDAVAHLVNALLHDSQAALAELDGDTEKKTDEALAALEALEAHGEALTVIETEFNNGKGVCDRPDVGAPPEATPLPSIEIPDETGQYMLGDVVTITSNGEPYAEVTVSRASVKKRYDGPYDIDDVPARGNVYIQALVTYKALTNGVDYNPFDWQVFVNDEAGGDYSFVSNGPTPTLESGTLPKGRKASGWMIFEVAAKGAVRMSYGGGSFTNEAPIFEVLIRSR